MSYVDAAIARLKDEAERKATTPPTPDAGVTYAVLREFGWCGWCADGICSGDRCQRRVHERLASALVDARAEVATLTAQLAAAKVLSEWRILNVRGEAVADATHPDEHTLPWWDRNRPNDAPHRLVQLAVIDAARTEAR